MLIAETIEEAWFLACKKCLKEGYEYEIERGSFAGHKRKQLPVLSLRIKTPWVRPLCVFYQGRAISTDRQIEDYFVNYLMSDEKKENEVYTYGSRIVPYLLCIIEMLKETPYTNQATIEVGRPEDVLLEDPPCLRVLSWKLAPDGLQLTSFWRSWDGSNAFPINVGGIQLLNEYMAIETGLKPGQLICFSDGFHIYKDFNVLGT